MEFVFWTGWLPSCINWSDSLVVRGCKEERGGNGKEHRVVLPGSKKGMSIINVDLGFSVVAPFQNDS